MRTIQHHGASRLAALAWLCGALAAPAWAHTLPISYLTLAPDARFLHLELTFNPFELNFFAELDRNHNSRLDAGELKENETLIARKLLECLRLSVEGRPVQAEISGLAPDSDSHHVTLRAHYRVEARGKRLQLESRLAALTSGSHVTEVTYHAGNRSLRARLDMQSVRATFGPPARKVVPPVRKAQAAIIPRAHPERFMFVAFALLGAVGGVAWLDKRVCL